MKKILCFLLALMLIVCTGSVGVVSASSDFVIKDGVLVGYKGTATYVEIPENVYYIGDSAFEGNTNVQTVMLNDNVKFIGNKAFYNCTGLKALGGASDVSSVGAFALDGTPYFNSLKGEFVNLNGVLIKYNGTSSSVTIPNGIKSVAPYVFYNNTTITNLSFTGDTFDIGEGAFYGCTSLQYVTIPKSITSIGANAFKNTSWLNSKTGQVIVGDGILIAYKGSEETVNIKSSVKKIAPYSFYENTSIETVNMPSSVSIIGLRAFFGCTSLNTVNYSSTLKFIDEEAFARCTSLEKIILPKTVEHIGRGAFASCTSAIRAEIGDNISTLSYGVFADCKNLKSIYVKDNLKFIEDNCFWGCTNLAKLRLPSTVTSISDNACNNSTTTVYSEKSDYISNYCSSKNIAYNLELGDVDVDGEITIIDVSYIQMHVSKLVKIDDAHIEYADADYNGEITIQDATFAQMKIAKLL